LLIQWLTPPPTRSLTNSFTHPHNYTNLPTYPPIDSIIVYLSAWLTLLRKMHPLFISVTMEAITSLCLNNISRGCHLVLLHLVEQPWQTRQTDTFRQNDGYTNTRKTTGREQMTDWQTYKKICTKRKRFIFLRKPVPMTD